MAARSYGTVSLSAKGLGAAYAFSPLIGWIAQGMNRLPMFLSMNRLVAQRLFPEPLQPVTMRAADEDTANVGTDG
jgi:hypothetical protein